MITDPWDELGLTPEAPLEEIRERFRELVKAHPPDRDPEAFEKLRDAYASIQDPRGRARDALFGPPPLRDLDELRRMIRNPRHPAPAGLWFQALEELMG